MLPCWLRWETGGKAPGIDGLPPVFYSAFRPVLGEDLLCVLRDSLRRGWLLLRCRRAIFTLLPKKGDLRGIKDWCLVSFVCTDYKLLSRVLVTNEFKSARCLKITCVWWKTRSWSLEVS